MINKILISLLFPFSVFGEYDLAKTPECNSTTESIKPVKSPTLQDAYTHSAIYLDIEQAFSVDIYRENEKDSEDAQTIVKM